MKPSQALFCICLIWIWIGLLCSLSHCQEQPRPLHHDRIFTITKTFDYTASFSDATISSGAMSRNCYEVNTLFYGQHPGANRYVAEMTAITTGAAWLSSKLRHSRHRLLSRYLWSVPMLIDAGSHTIGALQTFNNCY